MDHQRKKAIEREQKFKSIVDGVKVGIGARDVKEEGVNNDV